MWCRSYFAKSSARKDGTYRACVACCSYLVLEVASIADRTNARYDLRDLERVLYFENYVVIEPGLTDLSYGQMLSEEEFMDAQDTYGIDAFTANIGAEAIREMLAVIDLEAEADRLREELKEATGELKPKKIIKRLKVVESFLESEIVLSG